MIRDVAGAADLASHVLYRSTMDNKKLTGATITDDEIEAVYQSTHQTNDHDLARECVSARATTAPEARARARQIVADYVNRALGLAEPRTAADLLPGFAAAEVVRINDHWATVDGRYVLVSGIGGVILTREEADVFKFDESLQEQCRVAAQAAGLRGLVACHTIGGYMPGTVEVR